MLSSQTQLPPRIPAVASNTLAMGDSNIAEHAALIKSLSTTIESLKVSVAELQHDRHTDSSTSVWKMQHTGEHFQDRPPRFQKMDFPRFDGKSDPLVFINRCESYFH
jgi:hypothetical protein